MLPDPPLSENERKVLEALTGGFVNVAQLRERTDIASATLTRELTALEHREPALVERLTEQSGGGEDVWRATTAGLEAVGAL